MPEVACFTEEDRAKLDELHTLVMGLQAAIAEVAANPVAGAMLKNFGLALPSGM